MTFQYVFKRYGALLADANTLQRLFSEIDILEIIEVLEDGFTDIVRRASFSRRFSMDCGSRMASMRTSTYKYITGTEADGASLHPVTSAKT
jgi:hypothetical protein